MLIVWMLLSLGLKPGVLERTKKFHIKNKNFCADKNFKAIDNFVSKLGMGLQIIENMHNELAENLFKNEFFGLQKIIDMKNKSHLNH